MAENSFADDINIADDIELRFGSDDDATIAWDSAAARLEFRDAGGNVLAHLSDAGTTGALVVTGSMLLPDDAEFTFGTDSDIKIKYDTGDARLEFLDPSNNVLMYLVDGGTAGILTVNGIMRVNAASDGLLRISGAASGNLAHLGFTTGDPGDNNNRRWLIEKNNTAESGSNAGSNLDILARTDTGTALGTALQIIRSTMAANFGGNVGIRTAPESPFEVNASSTVGMQLVTLDQDDTDQAFIDFQGSTGANTTSTVSTLTTSGAIQGHLMIEVNGTKRWLAILADPS